MPIPTTRAARFLKVALVALTVGLAGPGCRHLEIIGHATVQDFVYLDGIAYVLTAIDGQPVHREPLPPVGYTHPAAYLRPGAHVFKATGTPPGFGACKVDVTFTATVESGKQYCLTSAAGQLGLVEAPFRLFGGVRR